MFTGLIEDVCKVIRAGRRGDSMRLAVDLAALGGDCRRGDSIAVNGACLTVVELAGGVAEFDISSETLDKSTLGELTPGRYVNIERAIKADGRFGGHFVQGHVDGIGTVESIEQKGEFWDFVVSVTEQLADQMVSKGSVAVDGISLTIASLEGARFTVAVIPETSERTTLGRIKAGEKVNIETDMIVKVVKKQLGTILPEKSRLTIDKLKQMGF